MSRANFVQVQLAAAATSSQTLLSVKAPVGGFVLPPADGGRLVLTDSPGRPNAYEIVTYTSRSGSGPYTLNGVTRGVEGTSPRAWAVDTFVMQSLTVGELDELLAGKVDKTTQVIAGTGLEGGGSLSANRTLSVKYGTTAGTAAEGNDSRLSNSREWTASVVSQAEAEAGTATTARKWTAQRVRQAVAAFAAPLTRLITAGTGLEGGGDLTEDRTLSVKYGTTAGTAAEGNDSRLSNSREWTASTVTQAEAEAGTATTRRAWTAQRVRQAIVAWWASSAEKTKLDGIQAGAQVNTVISVAGKTGAVVVTKADVGLSAVDNTSDANKPVSTAQQAALDLKLNADANAVSATKLATARTINGTSFDGSANITTANWGTARTLTVGNTSKSVNGSANVSWTLAEIGAAAASHTHSYLPLSGGSLTGQLNLASNGGSSWILGTSGSTAAVRYNTSAASASNWHSWIAGRDSANNGWAIGTLGTNFHVSFATAANITAGNNTTTQVLSVSSSGVSVTGTLSATGGFSGNAATATKLATARTINGVSFDGTSNITITAAANGGTSAACSGNAATATKLATARTINGVSFDGSANITITAAANGGTSAACSGNAATATKLATARTINGVSFDGSKNITITAAANGGTADSATTATKLATARTINGVSFDGSANITLPTVNTSGNQTISGTKTFSGSIVVSGTTNSTSATTGSLQTRGGLGVSGNIYAAGNVTAYSDVRLKTDIQTIPDALDKVCQLGGYTYLRTDTGERQTGVIAQEVQKVLPEAVTGDETLGVAYGNMAGLFIEAIKELTRKIEDQQARIDELERRTTA